MLKQKQYDWKDSNLALFGTETERKIKEASANTEQQWQVVGKTTEPHLFIWRIEKFKVVPWPKEQYGLFFNGDSYIVLNVWKKEDSLMYDAHFWIGKSSSQDEYATAAYKTVELDTYLKDAAIQYREVEGAESAKFLSYFKHFATMDGGVESGFNHVKPTEYKPRLYHCRGNKKAVIKETAFSRRVLDQGDVFILDLGLKIFQWNGETSHKDERFAAMEFVQKLRDLRNGRAKSEVLDSADTPLDHEFYQNLPDVDVGERATHHKKPNPNAVAHTTVSLHRISQVSDASGELTFEKLAEGAKVRRNLITEDDAFVVDTGVTCFVYIGEHASGAEKKNAIPFAHNYLKDTDHHLATIVALKKGTPCPEFYAVLS